MESYCKLKWNAVVLGPFLHYEGWIEPGTAWANDKFLWNLPQSTIAKDRKLWKAWEVFLLREREATDDYDDDDDIHFKTVYCYLCFAPIYFLSTTYTRSKPSYFLTRDSRHSELLFFMDVFLAPSQLGFFLLLYSVIHAFTSILTINSLVSDYIPEVVRVVPSPLYSHCCLSVIIASPEHQFCSTVYTTYHSWINTKWPEKNKCKTFDIMTVSLSKRQSANVTALIHFYVEWNKQMAPPFKTPKNIFKKPKNSIKNYTSVNSTKSPRTIILLKLYRIF